MATVVTIRGEIPWTFALNPATGLYIGFCEPLGLNADGETFHDLRECMEEATDLLFHALYEDDELDAFLREKGWELVEGGVAPGAEPSFDVPFDQNQIPYEDLVEAVG